tara:strand:+ start:4850 stop:5092 length:243 start_codon:yes stop_codon:yes gene_type:complete
MSEFTDGRMVSAIVGPIDIDGNDYGASITGDPAKGNSASEIVIVLEKGQAGYTAWARATMHDGKVRMYNLAFVKVVELSI